jgi:metal-responsive CopG/Arc/MetJ family transcriptional regulator
MRTQIRTIPLTLDKQLLSEIDAVCADFKESRSGVMRQAMRAGLPLVKSGGKADVLTLDSELSAEVDQATKEIELNRNKILLEAIRTGLSAFVAMKVTEKSSLDNLKDPKERELIIRAVEENFKLYHDPMVREHRIAVVQRGEATTRLRDILEHVPEAKRRNELVNRLTEIQRAPNGPGGGPVWLSGLSTEELEWQLEMSEKYGPRPSSWPEDIKKAHYAAEDAKKNAAPASKSAPKPLSQESKKRRN